MGGKERRVKERDMRRERDGLFMSEMGRQGVEE